MGVCTALFHPPIYRSHIQLEGVFLWKVENANYSQPTSSQFLMTRANMRGLAFVVTLFIFILFLAFLALLVIVCELNSDNQKIKNKFNFGGFFFKKNH
jgi:hypothetical protein